MVITVRGSVDDQPQVACSGLKIAHWMHCSPPPEAPRAYQKVVSITAGQALRCMRMIDGDVNVIKHGFCRRSVSIVHVTASHETVELLISRAD